MSRQPRVHRPFACSVAAVVVMLSGAACQPLDGRSATVELERSAALASSGGAEPVPWWVSTTTQVVTTSVVTTLPPVTTPPPPPPAAPPPPTEPLPPPPPPTEPPPPAPLQVSTPQRARALTTVSSPERRQVAARALGLVSYDWPDLLPEWQVRFMDGRAGVRGLTFPDRKVIEVYVRSGDTPEGLAHVVAHELGHAVDVSFFTQAQRSAWLAARGLSPRTTWFPGAPGVSDFGTGAGDFAESFAWVHASVGRWSGELAPPPNLVQAGFLALLSAGG